MITNLEQIKEAMPMATALSHLGIEVDRNGKCPCPVHNGKDKNFITKEGIGICYSQCGGQSWDVIELLKEIKGFTFVEACDWISSKTGVSIESDYTLDKPEVIQQQRERRSRKKRLADIAKECANYFESLADFPSSHEGMIDVDGRTVMGLTRQTFMLGRAPESEGLRAFAKTKQLNESDLLHLGYLVEGKTGIYEMYRHQRLMIPHIGERGEVIGFAGRLKPNGTQNEKAPKYINSRASDLYDKSAELFGLYQARRAMRSEGNAILTEGPWDVITMHDHGIANAVASQGTALTEGQAIQLRKYVETVFVMRDPDEAGIKATKRDVETLIKQRFNVRVVILPDGHDPDSYLRDKDRSAKGMREAMKSDSHDGLIWLIEQLHDPNDISKREASYVLAGRLIANYRSEVRRTTYVDELTRRGKILATGRSTVQEEVDKAMALTHKRKVDYTAEQESDAITYQIFVRNNKFYEGTNPESMKEISNFALEPIVLVIGHDTSKRLVKLTNQYGQTKVLDVDSDHMTELSNVKKVVERYGNFVFNEYAKPEHWIRIKRKLYDKTKDAYELPVLGWNPAGFYAFANGVISEGRFRPINEHGIVQAGETRYFLPEHSVLRNLLTEESQSDDFGRTFIYASDAEPVNFGDWSELMMKVFGDYGCIGLAWMMMAVHRTVVFKKLQNFPHLNLFGPPTSGKSFMGIRLRAPFGLTRKPLNLHSATPVAFAREMAKARDQVVLAEEYSNDLHPKMIEALKDSFDGTGRLKGVATTDNRTMRTGVNSGLVLIGQHQPVADVALFTRCISLSFSIGEVTEQQKKDAEKLDAMNANGAASTILPQLLGQRKNMERHLAEQFGIWKKKFRDKWPTTIMLNDRMHSNYAVVLATQAIYEKELDLPYNVEEHLLPMLIKVAVKQTYAISSENETSVWWDLVAFGIQTKELQQGIAYGQLVDTTVKAKDVDEREVEVHSRKGEVVAISLNSCYRFYKQRLSQERGSTALGKGAILHYLKGSPGYLGYVSSYRIGDKRNTSVHLFKLEDLPDGLGLLQPEVEESPF